MIDADEIVENYFKHGHDFSKGVSILEDTIRLWIKECVNNLLMDFDNDLSLKSSFYSISSGNTNVFVTMSRNKGKYGINVIVSKNFIEYSDVIADDNYMFNVP